MAKKPIVVIHISGREGEQLDLLVHENDDPSVVGKRFLEEQNLPLQLLPIIAQKIVDSVLEASFKKVGRPTSPSRLRSVKRQKPSPAAVVRSSSSSPGSRSKRHQQQSCDELYAAANRYDRHKAELRQQKERERADEVIESDFRYQLSQSPSRWKAHIAHGSAVYRGESAFEELYRQAEAKAVRLSAQREEVQRKRLEEEQAACQPIPSLRTSRSMQPPPSPSGRVFEELYRWGAEQRYRMDLSRSQQLAASAPSFSPRICNRSVELAERRLRARSLSPHPLGGAARTQPTTELRPLFLSHHQHEEEHEQGPMHARDLLSPTPSSPPQHPYLHPLPTQEHDLDLDSDQPQHMPAHPMETVTVDEEAVQRLRAVSYDTSSNTSSHTTAAARYSPFSHRALLRVCIPSEEEDEEVQATATAVSPLSEGSLLYFHRSPSFPSPLHRDRVPEYVDKADMYSSVFERLYLAKDEQQALRHTLSLRHSTSFSSPQRQRHMPAEEQQALCQRLYEHANKQANAENEARISAEKARLALAQPKGQRTLTIGQNDRLVARLLKAREQVDGQRLQHEVALLKQREQMSGQRHTNRRSAQMVSRRQAESLGEIFDVLLVTVQFRRELQPQPQPQQTPPKGEDEEVRADIDSPLTPEEVSYIDIEAQLPVARKESRGQRVVPNREVVPLSPPPQGCGEEVEGEEALLDTCLADASLLKPYLLHTTIQEALLALRPRRVSRSEFVQAILGMMSRQALAPLSYLLTAPSKRLQRKAAVGYVSSYDTQAKDCTHRPALQAAKVTNKLVQQRHPERVAGKEKVEESLLSCGQRYAQRREELKKHWDSHEYGECTFQPAPIAGYMRDARLSVQNIRKQQQTEIQQQSPTRWIRTEDCPQARGRSRSRSIGFPRMRASSAPPSSSVGYLAPTIAA